MNRPALVPELQYERPEERFVYLVLGSAHLMLEETPGLARATPEQFRRGQWRSADLEHPFGRGINLEIRVSGIDAIAARLAQGERAMLLDPHARVYRVKGEDYRVRQLLVADPDGYLIRLSEPRDSVTVVKGVAWSALESGAPDLARFGRERLHGQVAYLATARASRQPRLHPVTPIVGEGRLYLFMEPTSPKGHDLERGRGYALHSSVRDSEGSNGEFVVSGFARRCGDPPARRQAESLATYEPRARCILFELTLLEALATTCADAGPIRTRWSSA